MSRYDDAKLAKILNKEALTPADLDILPYAAMIMDKTRTVLAANRSALELGVKIGTPCWDSFGQCASIPQSDKDYYEQHNQPPADGTKCHFCLADQALSSQIEQCTIVTAEQSSWDTYWIPLDNGQYLHFAIALSDDQIHSQS